MTTEEGLRRALEELRAWTGDFWPVGQNNPKSRGAKCETVFEMRELVRAALARPSAPSRVEEK